MLKYLRMPSAIEGLKWLFKLKVQTFVFTIINYSVKDCYILCSSRYILKWIVKGNLIEGVQEIHKRRKESKELFDKSFCCCTARK